MMNSVNSANSVMYERLKRLYADGRLKAAGLAAAVSRGWISDSERLEILGGAGDEQMDEGDR